MPSRLMTLMFLNDEFSIRPPAYLSASDNDIKGFTRYVPGFLTAPITKFL